MNIGDKFGDRIIISEPFLKFKYNRNVKYIKTKCKCGEIKEIPHSQIINGRANKCKTCHDKDRSYDITNERSGLLVAKKYIGKYDGKHSQWEIHCDCGKICYATAREIRIRKRTSCGCDHFGKKSDKWKGYEDITGTYLYRLIFNAKKRNIEFNITIEDIWKLFLKQNRKCALSGIDLKFYKKAKDKTQQTASLDRIDSSKGYTIDNVQWIHKTIQFMKMNLKQEEFLNFCKEIVLHKNLLNC